MMKILGAAAILAGMAMAQTSYNYGQPYYGQPAYDRPYGDNNLARQDRALFDRARMDLDRASNYPYASKNDRKRFDEARRDLFDFTARFDQGRYDRHHLDTAIDRLQNVISHNSLDPRDRGALDDYLRRMRDYREFRQQHGQFAYGYR